MAKRSLDLAFPVGGLDERLGYQQQRPFTTPDALNVRPEDVFERRERGGSRPGLIKAFSDDDDDTDDLNGAVPRMLGQVRTVATSARIWSDSFIHTGKSGQPVAGNWLSLAGSSLPEYMPLSVAQNAVGYYNSTAAAGTRNTVLDLPNDFDSTSTYRITLVFSSTTGTPGASGATWLVYCRLNGTGQASSTGGFVLLVQKTPGIIQQSVVQFLAYAADGTLDFDTGQQGLGFVPEVLTVELNPANKTIEAWGNGIRLVTRYTFDGAGNVDMATLGSDMGFGVITPSGADEYAYVTGFALEYTTTTTANEKRVYAVASSNGTVFRDGSLNIWTEVSNTASDSETRRTLATDRKVNAVDYLQKLYIADYGLKHTGTDGALAGDPWTSFTSSGIGDFTTASPPVIKYDDCVRFLDAGSDLAYVGVHRIDEDEEVNPNGNTIVLAAAAGKGAGASSGIDFRIERTPKIYDPIDNTLDAWTASSAGPNSAGTAMVNTVPIGCPLIAVFLSRIVMGGSVSPVGADGTSTPNVFYMSAIDDPLDWQFGTGNPGGAVAGDGTHDVGQVGAPLTALIPHTKDYLLFGTNAGIWVLRGDPTYGGRIDVVSTALTIVDANAWCKTPEGETVILSQNGVYVIGARIDSYPTPVSPQRLPAQLRYVNPKTHTVHMAYDINQDGVCLFLTPNTGGGGTHWFIDWRTKSFWPDSYQNAHEPTAVLPYEADLPTSSGVLLAGRDGYVRKFSRSANTDDGNNFSSYAYIGPIKAGGYYKAIVSELMAIVASKSGDVDWSLHLGKTVEEAKGAEAFARGTWSAGLNYKNRPRGEGAAFFIKVGNGEDNAAWTLERIMAVVDRKGALRP